MKITIISAAFMAATAVATPLARRDVAFIDDAYSAVVGSPLTINWGGASGAVTINLKSGESNNLQTIATVASNTWGTSITWTPTASGTYALEIIDSSGTAKCSPQFHVGERIAPSLTSRSPRFSLSRWLLDQPQLSKEQRVASQRNEHLNRRQGKPTETENKLKEFAMMKDLIKVPDWKEALLGPVNALCRAIAGPWTKVAHEMEPVEGTEVVEGGQEEIEGTKSPGAEQVEVEESPRAEETFTQGDGWKGDNFRHGTWTSKSKDVNKNQGMSE